MPGGGSTPSHGLLGGDACAWENVAVMLVLVLMVMVHGPVPVHEAPVHPVKVDPESGVGLRVMEVPCGNCAVQVVPQSMPLGVLRMVPLPVPVLLTLRVNEGDGFDDEKTAMTCRGAFMVNAQVLGPVQSPIQLKKVEPESGMALRVTV